MAGIVGKSFTAADVGENEVWSFDFAKVLDAGESIASATWKSSDTAILNPTGPVAFTGTIVSQRHQAVSPGIVTLGCMIHTSTGNDRHLFAIAQVMAPSA